MEDFLKDLIDILRIPSIYSDNEKPFGKEVKRALHFMLDLAKKDGFKVKNVHDYAGHIEYGQGKEILGILCHLDVVDAKGNWQSDPFEPIIKDNKIYARGANDDKGPLMAVYYALKELKAENYVPNKKIRLIIGCNEEINCACIKEYLKSNKTPDLAFSPDADFPVIYGEKAILSIDIKGEIEDDDIIYIHANDRYNVVPNEVKFKLKNNKKEDFLSFLKEKKVLGKYENDEYTIYGISSHAMHPQKGLNAIYLMAEFLSKDNALISFINKYFLYDHFGKKMNVDCCDKEMKELTMNLGILHLENNKFKMGINYRIPTMDNYHKLIGELNKLPFKYEVVDFMEPHYVDPKSYLVQTLFKAYKKNTLDNAVPYTIGGGTYAKFIPNCVAFGPTMPNEESTCHNVDEYQDLLSLEKAKKIYKEAIKELTR